MRIVVMIANHFVVDVYEKISKIAEELEYQSVGFVNCDPKEEKFSMIGDYPFYPISYATKLNYDVAIVDVWGREEDVVLSAVSTISGVSKKKMVDWFWLLQQKMIRKYEDVQDPEIQATLKYWQNHALTTPFNQYLEGYKNTYDKVFIDENNGLPYIWFETVEGNVLSEAGISDND